MNTFQSYYSLIFNSLLYLLHSGCDDNFNPIIVLFLTTIAAVVAIMIPDFNPIIVLFLTGLYELVSYNERTFQSYYSLIFNDDDHLYIDKEDAISILL